MRSVTAAKFGSFILLLLQGFWVQCKDVPAPNKGDRAFVLDLSDVLSEDDEVRLCQLLKTYFDSTSTQIAVLTEPGLENEDLFEYTHKVARDWGIGEADKDNGILIFIATADRKVRIHVGYGLEGSVPDFQAKRIIEQIMLPEFREGDYYEGIRQAILRIIELSSGEFIQDGRPGKSIPVWIIILIVVIFTILLISVKGNSFRTYDSSRPYVGRGHWPGGGFGGLGGGGFGGGGGGGFGGFGGGGFGGGGASGSW